MIDGTVGGESAAGEGRGLSRIEVTERHEIAVVGDRHALCVAAVLEQPCLGGVGADHLLPGGAGPAVRLAAAPAGVDEHRAEGGVQAGDLVAEDHRERGLVVACRCVQVGVADPAGQDVDDRTSRRGHRVGDLDLVEG